MELNRRGFLGSLAAFAAACTLDPDLEIWKPGAKLVSIPKVVGVSRPVILARGDIFTIAGRYAVNPLTRKAVTVKDPFTGAQIKVLQRFMAIETFRESNMSEPGSHCGRFWPPVIPSGQFQNIEIDQTQKVVAIPYRPKGGIGKTREMDMVKLTNPTVHIMQGNEG